MINTSYISQYYCDGPFCDNLVFLSDFLVPWSAFETQLLAVSMGFLNDVI